MKNVTKLDSNHWIMELQNLINTQYLQIENCQIIFETIPEDGRYYDELDIISFSSRYMDNEYEIKKALYHELRHRYQKKHALESNDPLAKEFQYDFQRKKETGEENPVSILELDAYAFEYRMLKELDGIITHHPNPLMQALIHQYTIKYKDYL